ncbi:hypothetical protein SAMN02910298_02742 [Pseudobutyrivibrio sp. YE44]|uniref:hypothetical protein n=1 Tax=Pseudobutyrivibrio sp. YE44 TaxID=1520802 RepID=UPI00088D7D0F|nr:hypothetical protein [Pseudobutyrivibrio sp. YE44]SDB53619.1 hypothetical protein SAMN02910298_02742 [Pseudobutyrivibrio sp. YE44]
MIQEKYNRRIFDEGTDEAIQLYSHLRSNALSPVNIMSSDQVLVINPDSVSLVEWMKEKADNTIVGMTNDYGLDMEDVARLIPEEIEKKLLTEIKDKFNIIFNIGSLAETPATLKDLLQEGGCLVYALAEKDRLSAFTKKLLKEAGFGDIKTFRLHPDYMYTTEIYAEDYIGGGAGDYLLIARE